MTDWIDPDTGEQEMSRKRLASELALLGIEVSPQAIGYWLRGEWSPKPHHQAALARVFDMPVSRLFPVTFEAAS
jgi:transcriptional regulator with XRE-family HTH domain